MENQEEVVSYNALKAKIIHDIIVDSMKDLKNEDIVEALIALACTLVLVAQKNRCSKSNITEKISEIWDELEKRALEVENG